MLKKFDVKKSKQFVLKKFRINKTQKKSPLPPIYRIFQKTGFRVLVRHESHLSHASLLCIIRFMPEDRLVFGTAQMHIIWDQLAIWSACQVFLFSQDKLRLMTIFLCF